MVIISQHAVNEVLSGKRVVREENTVMRPSSEVMTCGFDRWEETMEHMMLVTNNG
jgi:hypothetical protein